MTLEWLRAQYNFHTFCYRDPRSASSSASGIPVVSPTAVLLGIASTLFSIGMPDEALAFLQDAHLCRVAVDPPEGAVFFRAFHQLRRYISTDPTKGKTHRVGFTDINQGTKEYALVDGPITLFIGLPEGHLEAVKLALRNRDHLGTHDSLCSLLGEVERCDEPLEVVYLPPERWQEEPPHGFRALVVTLARFANPLTPTVGKHWWMAGGDGTELVPYVIKGWYRGTTRGKVYCKSG